MNSAAKVGVFFLIVMILAGILIFKIEDIHLGRNGAKTVSIVFNNVSGLDDKATVRVACVGVGQFKKIRQIEGRAYVDVEIYDPNVELRQGHSAAIDNLGLL